MDFINQVPDEILVRFFDADTTLQQLSKCAMVSKRWHAVAKEHPTFWSSAEFRAHHQIPLFLDRLNRRPGLPIKIRSRAVRLQEHRQGFEAIAQNMHRITELDIYTWDENWVLHSRAFALPAPILVRLRIEVDSQCHGSIALPRSLFGGSAPFLTSVVLKDATFLFGDLESLSFPSVTHASIMYTNAYITPDSRDDRNAVVAEAQRHWLVPFDLLDRVVSIFPRLQSLHISVRPQVLRTEFPQLARAPPGFVPEAEDIAYLYCPALRVLMVEAEVLIVPLGTERLEEYLRDLDAPTDRMTLCDEAPPEERTLFGRVVTVDDATGQHTDWLARADVLLRAAI
ncbi:hypothetical protein AURDEDRAFT_164649 [Auricularia subglabra TFB-10046 SS5]|nr:hypothetical protein AURDEDRAFT_164649 [Auricularia subglabra TFB-10046 SS5]